MTAFFCEKMKYLITENELPKAYFTLIFRKNNILRPTRKVKPFAKSPNPELIFTYL